MDNKIHLIQAYIFASMRGRGVHLGCMAHCRAGRETDAQHLRGLLHRLLLGFPLLTGPVGVLRLGARPLRVGVEGRLLLLVLSPPFLRTGPCCVRVCLEFLSI